MKITRLNLRFFHHRLKGSTIRWPRFMISLLAMLLLSVLVIACGLKSLPANPPMQPALDTYLHQLSPTIIPAEGVSPTPSAP